MSTRLPLFRSLACLLLTCVLRLTCPPLSAQGLPIWGSGPGDVWVGVNARVFAHYDGRAWSEVPTPVTPGVLEFVPAPIAAIWGRSASDVFAVGRGGLILHYDGRAWSIVPGGTELSLVALSGTASNLCVLGEDVYQVGAEEREELTALVLRYDGRAWSRMPRPPVSFRPTGVLSCGADVVLAGVFAVRGDDTEYGLLARLSGGRWTFQGFDGQRVTDSLFARAGWLSGQAAGSTQLLVGAERYLAVVLLGTGGGWQPLPPPLPPSNRGGSMTTFLTADGAPVALVTLTGDTAWSHWQWTQGAWAPIGSAPPQAAEQPPAPAPRRGGLLGRVRQRVEQAVQPQAQQQLGTERLGYGLGPWVGWGPTPRDYYLTDQKTVWHVVDGQATAVYRLCESRNRLVRHTGLGCGAEEGPPIEPSVSQSRALGIWGSGAGDIWVVGNRWSAVHWNGQAWSEMRFDLELSGALSDVWASGPRDVFAVGARGTILHYDGTRWTTMTAPTSSDLLAVRGRSPTDVYALARETDTQPPVLLRYDGSAWTAIPLPFRFSAADLAVSGTAVLVAGGDVRGGGGSAAGVVASYESGRWTVAGWDGQRVTDPVVGAGTWKWISSAAGATLVAGEQGEEGSPAFALGSAAGWSAPPPIPARISGGMRDRLDHAFVARDGTPVAILSANEYARFVGGRWERVQLNEGLMLSAMGGAAPPPAGGPLDAEQQRRRELQRELTAHPEALVDLTGALAVSNVQHAWGASARDFYVATSDARIVHVRGEESTIVYSGLCADADLARTDRVCQLLRPSAGR